MGTLGIMVRFARNGALSKESNLPHHSYCSHFFSLCDPSTEHIALLGKALTASEEEGYEIARQLADYVLIWGGGGGDDLAKSPHLARIANSVYRDHCVAGDPTCRSFGFIVRTKKWGA